MNLQYWRQLQKISQRVAREVLTLSKYNIEIHHIKGTRNGWADALLRRPDYDKGVKDNENVTVLLDCLFIRHTKIGKVGWTDQGQYIIKPTMVDIPYFHQEEEIIQQWIKPH